MFRLFDGLYHDVALPAKQVPSPADTAADLWAGLSQFSFRGTSFDGGEIGRWSPSMVGSFLVFKLCRRRE